MQSVLEKFYALDWRNGSVCICSGGDAADRRSEYHLMRAESPGPSVGKLVPKIRKTSMILYKIYIVMSVIMVAFLMIGKMPLFDSLLLMFGSAGTGGFSILNTGCATYTPYVQYVIAIFMMLFGITLMFIFSADPKI